MAFTQETVTHHKDVGKHSGTAAEHIAKQAGLGAFAKKIGEFVNKLVGKKQKEMIDAKNPKPADGTAAPAQPVTAAH
jgi:ribosomal protein L12E/L44/L45/RPP1/RPP2